MPDITYQWQIAFKLDWQDWTSLPAASLADAAAFYDVSLPHKGRNLDSWRFSGKQGFETYVRVIAEISEGASDTHVTEYISESPAGQILDNDEQTMSAGVGSPTWSAAVVITDSDANVLPSGYLKQDDLMTMVVTFTLSSGDTDNYPGAWGIHRIQKDLGGIDIEEFSSIRDNQASGIFQPITGQTHLKVEYVSATVITTTSYIDGTKLVPGQTYNISAQIDYTPA